jgi:hypothetical protein
LQYLNARYYDPELGMFIQPDWFEVTEPGVGRNRYSYSFNDPVNGRDPGGNRMVEGAYDGGLSADERDDSDIVSYDICSDRGCMTGIHDVDSDWQIRTSTYANPVTGMGNTLYQSDRDMRALNTALNTVVAVVTLPLAVGDAAAMISGFRAARAGKAMAAAAGMDQISAGYAADRWGTTILQAGEKVYGGLPGQSAYYTNAETIVASGTSRTSLFKSLQVAEHPAFGFRPNVGEYEVVRSMMVPFGKALANTRFGSGGGSQLFIKDFENSLRFIRQFPLGQ